MQPDDELCLCFHVTQRKVINFLHVEKPRVASQMSECHGAGTGCGWCRPFLLKLWETHKEGKLPTSREMAAAESKNIAADDSPIDAIQLPTAAEYAKQRASYVKQGGGTPPPGATPIE
jgi:NAD(P)H-nitrite reductase large subunit